MKIDFVFAELTRLHTGHL